MLSDAVLKQFLLHLDETLAFGRKFVLEDLDETHLFISNDIVNTLKEKVWELMDNNSFNVTKLDWKEGCEISRKHCVICFCTTALLRRNYWMLTCIYQEEWLWSLRNNQTCFLVILYSISYMWNSLYLVSYSVIGQISL